MKFSVPYLKMRDGRPRWEPGPKLRKAGWKGRDLRAASGEWLSEADAVTAARALNDEVAAAIEASKAAPSAARTRVKHPRSCQALVDLWKASPRFDRKAASTKREYVWKSTIFTAEFGDKHVASIRKSDLYSWWEEMYRERGHAMANGVIAVVRVVLSYAVMKGWRHDNPAKSLGLETVPPRCVVWSPSEVELFVKTADAMRLHSIGDAVVLALHTAQRQGDVLELEHQRTVRDRAVFKQGKTGAHVTVPFTPALAERMAAIRTRRAAEAVTALDTAAVVVLDERSGQRYDGHRFRKLFRKVRDQAAAACHANGDPIRSNIAAKQFWDLRDTAVTRLALAGCTIPEIRAITGHELETIHEVLKHYLALDDRMAIESIRKLKAYMAEEGIAI
jgi:site-specific recombinase XerD